MSDSARALIESGRDHWKGVGFGLAYGRALTFSLLRRGGRRINALMHIPSLAKRLALILSALPLLTTSVVAAENPFLGRWALTIPGGGAGWLGITETNGELKGSILW